MSLSPPRKAAYARQFVLASYVLLVLVVSVMNLWAALPLLLFAWGLKQRDWRSHIWLCFMLLFYFLVNINQLADGFSAWLWLECFLIVTLFISALFYCRWTRQGSSPDTSTRSPVQGAS